MACKVLILNYLGGGGNAPLKAIFSTAARVSRAAVAPIVLKKHISAFGMVSMNVLDNVLLVQ